MARTFSELARAALNGSLINLVRLGLLAASIALLARMLGAREFGLYVGITAITAILATLAGLGAGQELIRAVSRDRSRLSEHRTHAIRMVLITSVVLFPASLAFSYYGLPGVSLQAVMALCAAELLLMPMVQLGAQALLACERFVSSQLLMLSSAAIRFCAIVALVTLDSTHDLATYAFWHLAAAGASAAAGLIALYGPGMRYAPSTSGEKAIGRGAAIAASSLSSTTFSELDKVLASQIASSVAAGLYGAAYRLAAAATAPIVSLAQAMQPKLYRLSHAEGNSSQQFVLKLAAATLTFGLLSGACLKVLAPYATTLLGPTYSPLQDLGTEFGVLTLLLSLRAMGGPILICLEQLRAKLVIEIAAIGLLIVSAMLFMRNDVGSVVHCVIFVELCSAIALWTTILTTHNRALRR